jgi:hypothetical protein
MHGAMGADWILQWMTYHHYLAEGKGHFFFYNMGGLAEEDRVKFQRFFDAGLLSITDILDPNLAADYPTWYYHQVLLINDCLHRSRFMAERVFFFDYDEFLQVRIIAAQRVCFSDISPRDADLGDFVVFVLVSFLLRTR